MGNGTSLGRVRGLGSAHEGTGHWWRQRVTAASNLLLIVWLLVTLARLPDFTYTTVTQWLASPLAAVPMILLVLSVFTHFRLGLQVVIEDYQHDANRILMLVLLNFFTVAAGALAVFSILKVAFAGAPA